MNYMISRVTMKKGIAVLTAIKNVPEWAHMQAGDSVKATFPDDAYFEFDPEFPKNVQLADVLENTNSLLVVSERFKDLLVAENALENNEVLEVGIQNHKKRREAAKYFVIHQVNNPVCVDDAKTVGEKSQIDKKTYMVLSKLVLDDTKIDPKVAVFRPDAYRARAFFRKDLVEKIQAAGITGIKFYELDGYTDFL